MVTWKTEATKRRSLLKYLKEEELRGRYIVSATIGALLGPIAVIMMAITDIFWKEPAAFTTVQVSVILVTSIFVFHACLVLLVNSVGKYRQAGWTTFWIALAWSMASLATAFLCIRAFAQGDPLANNLAQAGVWLVLLGWVSLAIVAMDAITSTLNRHQFQKI